VQRTEEEEKEKEKEENSFVKQNRKHISYILTK